MVDCKIKLRTSVITGRKYEIQTHAYTHAYIALNIKTSKG